MEWLIVGLGNPGASYKDTRHNIGSLTLETFPLSWKKKFKGLFAVMAKSVFLRPQTFMNLSGDSVAPCVQFYGLPPSQVVVVHDDLDLPFGELRLRPGGGMGGHNGLKSIAHHLQTQDFNRIRLGIGRPERGDVTPYVLSPFSQEQNAHLQEFLTLAAKAIEAVIEKGLETAAGQFSKKSVCP